MSIIEDFPGIDALLGRADAVVIALIRQHIPAREIRVNDTSEWYECTVQQTLKGELRPSSSWALVVLRLEAGSDGFARPLRENTVAVLFLRKHTKDQHGSEYASLRIIGSTIELAPFGSESVSPSGTPKKRIKALVQHYRQYRAKQMKREEALLQKVLRS